MLNVSIKASRILAFLLTAMHAFGIGLLWSLPLAPWLKAASMPVLLASLAFYLGRDAWRSFSWSVTALSLDSECKCGLQTAKGEWLDSDLLASSFVSPYLTVLNVRPRGAHWARHVIILPDAIDPERFRQLRVLLNWKCRADDARNTNPIR
jgi:toxin CptA